ncbi:MAG: hypothetical protein JAY75_12015 [Candidatus Thiodiazotropha taylori]|nr:hypothetical protein [Candidatus Thiodiazotropha taylori]MCW4308943.1 hypothetical protein [Candidatus Thiodiazotropha endolucinida]
MSQKQVSTASAAEIQREIEASCDDSETGNGTLQMASAINDTCSDKPTKKTSTAKSRSSSSSSKTKKDQKKESADKRIDSLEKKMEEQLGSILQIVQTLCKSQGQQETGAVTASQIPVLQDDCPSGVRGPVSEVAGPSGTRRPFISLENDLDREFEIRPHTEVQERPDDMLSLTPGQREKDSLGLMSGSEDDSKSGHSADTIGSCVEHQKSKRFCQYLAEKSVDKTQNVLSCLFGEDAGLKQTSEAGICLDQSQIDILAKSWRCENPEKLSAYKEEYKSVFPVHESSASMLQVPSLDELLEPMLSKKHGNKSVKGWGKSRQLATQPLKAIESVAYQGQIATRYGLISVSFIQQALGTLLNKLQSDNINIDSAIQSVRDIFAMATKALDQVGRSGAFHHIIRRKAAASDTGLNNLKDVQAKVLYLPLTGDGVFGKGLEENLKKRKEQKEQLSDLVPDFDSKTENSRKRKSYDNKNTWANKRQRMDYSNKSSYKPRSYPSYNRYSGDKKSSYEYKGKASKDTGSSFRIPNKTRK